MAASVLMDNLEPLAEQLDGLAGGETYRLALKSQREKLSDPVQVPSARVLADMKARGTGHREWGLEMARQHQKILRDEGLSGQVLADFERMTADSLSEQAAMEAADHQSFPEFLEQYLRS
jgi:glutamate--cysteine ligase